MTSLNSSSCNGRVFLTRDHQINLVFFRVFVVPVYRNAERNGSSHIHKSTTAKRGLQPTDLLTDFPKKYLRLRIESSVEAAFEREKNYQI